MNWFTEGPLISENYPKRGEDLKLDNVSEIVIYPGFS